MGNGNFSKLFCTEMVVNHDQIIYLCHACMIHSMAIRSILCKKINTSFSITCYFVLKIYYNEEAQIDNSEYHAFIKSTDESTNV